MAKHRVRRYGTGALLVECDPDDVPGLLGAIDAHIAEAVEAIPGARSILVRFDPARGDLRELAEQLTILEPSAVESRSQSLTWLPVRYQAPDLNTVAGACGLTVAEVIERHQRPTYTVAFCGFAPGFAYLIGLDPELQIPRRESPRSKVPAGSVAIAAEYSAVYPQASPGGWHLIGNCSATLFDVTQPAPALLVPGSQVRFEVVGQ